MYKDSFVKLKKFVDIQGLQVLQDDSRRRGILIDLFPDDKANINLLDRILDHTDIIVIKEACECVDVEPGRSEAISKKWKKELWLNDEAIKFSWDFFKQLFSAKFVSKIDVKKDECCDGMLVKKLEELENRISDMQDSITKISFKLTEVNNKFKDMNKMYNEWKKKEESRQIAEEKVKEKKRLAPLLQKLKVLECDIREGKIYGMQKEADLFMIEKTAKQFSAPDWVMQRIKNLWLDQ